MRCGGLSFSVFDVVVDTESFNSQKCYVTIAVTINIFDKSVKNCNFKSWILVIKRISSYLFRYITRGKML